VRAIEPTGKIVTAECFQCLDCQGRILRRCAMPAARARRQVTWRRSACCPSTG
jgi:hypothetical protein